MSFLAQTINILADLMITLIFLRVILSWFIPARHKLMAFLTEITEPLLGPIRKALPRFGMLDLSPIVAFFLISLIQNVFNGYIL